MKGQESTVTVREAAAAAEGAMSRVALLHLSFSRTIVDALGEGRGKDLIVKAIMDYGQRITERVNQGKPDLPAFGVYEDSGQDEEGRYYARGCTLAKVFKEHDALDLGCLYCYVDAAKWMAKDANAKMIHLTCEACGDENCTFDVVATTEEERRSFSERDSEWRKIDPRLHEYE
ncbi:MAG: L-2-amino-thiazoline-4-carboxylic acid hydrolase [Candidatus Thorarchaeota archaeon]|nr:MAG: L-2-amino-thiazoline-4-carboxylic acid hydrolase [Candidatus Thorarchaeota archaeon]